MRSGPLLAVALLIALSAGCGQRGDLYLPPPAADGEPAPDPDPDLSPPAKKPASGS